MYCCVRRYQEWLWRPLESLGFELFGSMAVMVKRLVVPVDRAVSGRLAHARAGPIQGDDAHRPILEDSRPS